MYQPLSPANCEFVKIRTLQYHVRTWGRPTPGRPPLVMLHGWMDVGASFQFVVDALREPRWVIAPDWRGYGLTEATHADSYWFPDYLGDLDSLLDHYAGDAPVDLVGHSMGGNISMLYAGARPGRIRRLVNLEGFGMPATRPEQAPERMGQWLDGLKALHRGELDIKGYDSREAVAQRLVKTNPRLDADKALWLAGHWSRQGADGRWRILGHAAHKVVNAYLYRVEEALAMYRNITAPVLSVQARETQVEALWKGRFTLAEYRERLKAVADSREALVTDAGHMMHHDQPEQVARLIEGHCGA